MGTLVVCGFIAFAYAIGARIGYQYGKADAEINTLIDRFEED